MTRPGQDPGPRLTRVVSRAAALAALLLVVAATTGRPDLAVLATGASLPPYREAGADGELLTSKAPLRDASGEVTAVITTSIPLGSISPGPEPDR